MPSRTRAAIPSASRLREAITARLAPRCKRCPDKTGGVIISPPDEPLAPRRKLNLGENSFRGGVAENDLLLAHPNPACVKNEAPRPIEEGLFVFSLQSAACSPKESQTPAVCQRRNQQWEVAAAGVFENLVDSASIIGGENGLSERLCLTSPRVSIGVRRNNSKAACRQSAPINKSVSNTSFDQRMSPVLGSEPTRITRAPRFLAICAPAKLVPLPPPIIRTESPGRTARRSTTARYAVP